MKASSLAQSAYSNTLAPTRTARASEYDAFARVTRALKDAQTSATKELSAKLHALHENRRLWTTLAADVASDGNQLPQTLRAQIFYLAEFTLHHSQKVMRENAVLTPLIEVNTAIMRGLKQQEQSS